MTLEEELRITKEELNTALLQLSAYQALEDSILEKLIEIVDEYRE